MNFIRNQQAITSRPDAAAGDRPYWLWVGIYERAYGSDQARKKILTAL
jgi:hypothetical protein